MPGALLERPNQTSIWSAESTAAVTSIVGILRTNAQAKAHKRNTYRVQMFNSCLNSCLTYFQCNAANRGHGKIPTQRGRCLKFTQLITLIENSRFKQLNAHITDNRRSILIIAPGYAGWLIWPPCAVLRRSGEICKPRSTSVCELTSMCRCLNVKMTTVCGIRQNDVTGASLSSARSDIDADGFPRVASYDLYKTLSCCRLRGEIPFGIVCWYHLVRPSARRRILLLPHWAP